jgi:succinate dehydrogenase/fumarate reductase flavoprotein subunit
MIGRNRSIFSCDVLIIGGGSAGLRSAIEAHDSGVENVLIRLIDLLKNHTKSKHHREFE